MSGQRDFRPRALRRGGAEELHRLAENSRHSSPGEAALANVTDTPPEVGGSRCVAGVAGHLAAQIEPQEGERVLRSSDLAESPTNHFVRSRLLYLRFAGLRRCVRCLGALSLLVDLLYFAGRSQGPQYSKRGVVYVY